MSGNGVVSHNTDAMRNWTDTMNENTDNYDTLVNRLYVLVDTFVGSEDFRGGLSQDFLNTVLGQKDAFLSYSETFKDCAELIKSTATNIDNVEDELKNRINANNYLG